MSPNVILIGWNRSIPGREHLAGAHFQEFAQYLTAQQQDGTIKSFDVVLLDAHGGDLNGFFLVRGDWAKLSAWMATAEFTGHVTKAILHTDGFGVIHGATGDTVMERMQLWTSLLPS